MRKIWRDITQNPVTGHYIALDLFKAVCYLTGIPLIVFAAVAKMLLLGLVIYFDFSARWINVDPPITPGVILVLLAMGMDAGKLGKVYLSRLTMDGNGHPLVTAGSADVPPPYTPTIMPQTPGVEASPPLPSE